MADHLSYQHAITVTRLMYERAGFKVGKKTPGQHVAEEGADISQAKLGALFALIDEFVFILRYQCHYLTSCLPNTSNLHAVTHLRLCNGTLSTLWSVRILSSNGLDLNARAQLRYLYELAVLWSRIQVDAEARSEFASTTPEGSNAYWHKFLAKRKSEKYLLKQVKAGDLTWLGALENLDSIYDKLSLSAHPSFVGVYHDTVAGHRMTKGWASRGPEGATHFTLASALFLTMLPFSLIGSHEWKFEGLEMFDPKEISPALPGAKNWDEYMSKMRHMLIGLGLASFKYSNEL